MRSADSTSNTSNKRGKGKEEFKVQTAERVFYFHGDANAVGGVLQHPEQRLIATNVSCAVPQAGGETQATLQGFRDGQTLTVDRAYTHAVGAAHPNGGWTTLVTAVLEGVNLLHVFTADRIVARLSVEHPAVGYGSTVSLVGSSFEGVRLAGTLLDLPVNPFFNDPRAVGRPGAMPSAGMAAGGVIATTSVGTGSGVAGSYGGTDRLSPTTPSLVNLALQQSREIAASAALPEVLKKRYTWVQSDADRTARRALLCSVVEGIRSTTGKVVGTTVGHIVSVPGLGTFLFGELIVSDDAYRLTMVRAELGCPVHGIISFATCNSNGSPMP